MCRRIPTAPSSAGGGLFFMDKRFDEIVAYLEKRFDVKINVADRALAERRFIASFVNGESLDEMLASFNADEAMPPPRRRPHRQHHQTLTLKRNRPWNKIDPRKKGYMIVLETIIYVLVRCICTYGWKRRREGL